VSARRQVKKATSKEAVMKELLGYRALGLLCCQRAVFDPEHSWQWLGQAERWEHLAASEIDSPIYSQPCSEQGSGRSSRKGDERRHVKDDPAALRSVRSAAKAGQLSR
jgi:hypothetical protein